MMTPEHSEGNWSYCPSEIDKHRPFAVLVEGTGSMIADVYLKTIWSEEKGLSVHPEISEANAKLIAAAPELLGALEEAIAGLEWRIECQPQIIDESDHEKVNEWKELIKKATE